jgi:nucleoside-diphosphate-sugar epimerase
VSVSSSHGFVRKGRPVGAPDGEVIVTGGLGFVGSHLVDAHLRAGHHLKIIDSDAGAVIDDDHDANPPLHGRPAAPREGL